MPTAPLTRPPVADAPPATQAAVLVAGSRLVAGASETGAADTLPQRLAWGGVRVAVLAGARDAAVRDLRLPADVAVSACVDDALFAVSTAPAAVALFLHDHDVDDASNAAAAAATHANVRVVRVASPTAVEATIAHSHARAGALMVGVCMRPSRERDLLARGMLPRVCGGGSAPVFELLPPADLARRLADPSAPRMDAILHKVTDELAAGGSACAGRAQWPEAARALASCAVPVVDDVACVMRLADRWATADALTAARVPTPRAVRVAAGTPADTVLPALEKGGLSFPIILKPRAACGTAAAHALAVVLDARGLAAALARVGCVEVGTGVASTAGTGVASTAGTGAASTAGTGAASTAADAACCDALAQQYVNHGGVLHKVYVAGDVVHVSQRASVPDLGSGGAASPPTGTHAAMETPSKRHDTVWLVFDSTDTATTAAELAATPAAASAGRGTPAAPPAPPPAADLDGVVSALRRGLGVTLFGFDVVVDRESGRLLVVDVNYFPSMGGVPPRAIADAVCASRLHT